MQEIVRDTHRNPPSQDLPDVPQAALLRRSRKTNESKRAPRLGTWHRNATPMRCGSFALHVSGGASGLLADTPLTAPAVAQIIGTFGTENVNARKRRQLTNAVLAIRGEPRRRELEISRWGGSIDQPGRDATSPPAAGRTLTLRLWFELRTESRGGPEGRPAKEAGRNPEGFWGNLSG